MTIIHITEALYPPRLRELVEKDLEYRPNLKKDVQAFIKFAEEQSEHVEKVRSWNSPGKNGKSKARDSNKKKKLGSNAMGNAGFPRSTGKDNKKGTITKSPPLCLYAKCRKGNKYHFLRNCTECTDSEERKKLLNEFIAQQKGKTRILKDKERNVEDSTTLMKATFAGTLTKVLCADSGSDVNLIGPKDLAALLSAGADLKVTKFHAPRQYQMATEEDIDDNKVFVKCDRAVRLDTRLHVRQAVGINLRNCTWMVSTQDVKEPLLGRHVIESLGLDIKQVLLAACDKFNGEVDMSKLLPEDEDIKGSVARICDEGIFHGHAAAKKEATLGEDDSLFVSIGDDKPEEIDTAFRELLTEAQTEGMSHNGLEKLSNMLNENRDIFRIRLVRDPAAKVEPMQLTLKPDSKPIIAKARRYSTPQRAFISTFTTKLEEYGFIKENKNAKWAATPLLVPKPPPVNYRLTFDYRPVNAATETILWPMRHIDSELSDTADSSAFAKLDFCDAYWQLPLDEDGQESLSFTTPNGVMKPMRTPQGGKNCASNFRAKVEPCFAEIRDNLKAWLDDFLVHCKYEDQLLLVLGTFFKICQEKGLKISALAHKTKLFKRKVRWCGRIMSSEGVQLDPERVSGLKDAHPPTTAGELCQYVHCLQWMSQAIPDFSARVAPLRKVLEEAYKKSGKRTRRLIRNLKLSELSWGPGHVDIFHSFQEQLKEAITLSHRDTSKSICTYTDASDLHWDAVVTQCDHKELEKEVSEQHHEPLAFLSSSFKNSELNWSTFEKEAFAIYQTFKKLDYMLACEDLTHIFTDHCNLLFVYHPWAIFPLLGRHIVSKALRWGLFFARFQYTIEHVSGESNVMADIMTRWYRGYRAKRSLMVRYIREYWNRWISYAL